VDEFRNLNEKGEIMDDMGVAAVAGGEPNGPGLTQWQRVADTFTAPSKTFIDIKRGNRSWWLPLIIGALFSYILLGAIMQKIGMQQVVDNQIRLDPKAQERMANATPEQRAMSNKFALGITEGVFVAGPVVAMGVVAVFSLVLMATINFGFGGKAKFADVFAVSYYAWLPEIFRALLGTIVIFSGMAPESFNIKNFAPTNLGAFLDPVETNKALYTLATWIDAITIWRLVLLGMGIAIVAGTKRSSGYIAVFGWWVLLLLVAVGFAAITG
jgi:hypothetical protein